MTVRGRARSVEHHQLVVGQADRRGGLPGLRQQRADGDQHFGLRVRQLLDDVLRGEQHVDRGGRRACAQNAVERDRERGAVGCEHAHHVADGDAALGQRPGERVYPRNHLAVRVLPSGLRIDECDPVRVGVIDICEEVLVNADRRDVDVGERAREAHGPDRTMADQVPGQTSSSSLTSFLGATIRNDASMSSATSSQLVFFLAVRSRPSQPDGPMYAG